MKQRLAMLWLLIMIGLMALPPEPTLAQMSGEDLPAGVTSDDVYRVSRQMYCDVCAGVPISDCPSPTCAAWRQEVANLLGQGYDDSAILEYFAYNYGDKVTGVPLAEGSRSLALGLPALLGFLIGVVVVWQIWRLSQRGQTVAMKAASAAGLRSDYQRPVPDNVDSHYLARFIRMVDDNR